jgi:ferredoxin
MVVVTSEKETVVNPETFSDMKKLGAFDVTKCMNCGLCTVSCPLSVNGNEFPRKLIRYAVLGLDDKLASHLEPWLCYYCGDCTEQCPSGADPGNFMMASRRYLTTKYDWTGFSKRFYLSKKWEFGSLIILALLILFAFVFDGSFNRMNSETVSINTFAPVEWIHFGDILVALTLFLLLLSNVFRMYYFVIFKDKTVKIPLRLYLSEIKTFLFNGMTQWKWRSCEKSSGRWLKHFLLVTGYSTMFLLVVGFLPVFQRDTSTWHWSAIPGYYGTAILLYVTTESMWSRFRKKEELHKYSHSTDWLFLILLFFTALSGILLHFFRLIDFPYPTYYLYVIHLMIAGPMLLIEVPFGKWSHMFYRPFAIYLSSVKQKAKIIASI